MHFDESVRMSRLLERLIPDGAHTYAKGPDQYPEDMAPVIARGRGATVWDVDGNEFVEYGSGLRSVAMGHGHPAVVAAVSEAVANGTNFSRPSALEAHAAEELLSILPRADMVKFAKNGSDVTSAAVRLARAVTGRGGVAICGDHPFFSVDDWFIGVSAMPAGIPTGISSLTTKFPYGDLGAMEEVLAADPEGIACLIMEAATTVPPPPGYLLGVRDLCDRYGVVMILDEMITGFRWDLGGAQQLFDVRPDLSTFGKALGNGVSVAALAGRRELMERGGLRTSDERVFLLSTTHGAESIGLAAACAVMDTYRREGIIEQLYDRGARVARGVTAATEAAGVSDHVHLVGRDCNLVFATKDALGDPSQQFRTLFLQQLLLHGVLAPSFVVSAALTDEQIDRTVDAVAAACDVYARALADGVERYLVGRPVRPTMRPYT